MPVAPGKESSARTVSTPPSTLIRNALTAGSTTSSRPVAPTRSASRRAWITSRPTPVNVIASPRLNATTSSNPKATRPSAIDPSITTSADGQGRMPPETPSASSPRAVIGPPSDPGGRWL